MAAPTFQMENLKPGEKGRFFDDYCSWTRIPEFEAAIHEDLAWLGLSWPLPVRRQSDHLAEYAAALEKLRALGIVYRCFLTRKEIAASSLSAISRRHASTSRSRP